MSVDVGGNGSSNLSENSTVNETNNDVLFIGELSDINISVDIADFKITEVKPLENGEGYLITGKMGDISIQYVSYNDFYIIDNSN